MKQKLWFNHWFNSAFHFIKLIRDNPDGQEFEIYGTNRNKDSAVLQACDYSEVEPLLRDEDYIEYCLDFCKKHEIEIFVPRHGLISISAHLSEFEKIGTRVLASQDVKTLQVVSDKGQFYESCKANNILQLPKYHIVNNVEEFIKAYEDVTSEGSRACFKPINGEGGSGFRVIDDRADTVQNLFSPISHKISLTEVIRVLSTQTVFRSLMVLEYLEGYEYSIDCLAYEGELLAIVPRKKLDSRVRVLEENVELINMSKRIFEAYKLPFVFNIQIKYSNGIPKILEINPRMSGGLHVSCLSGVNFPYMAIKLLTYGKAEIPVPKFGISTYEIEQAILMKETN